MEGSSQRLLRNPLHPSSRSSLTGERSSVRIANRQTPYRTVPETVRATTQPSDPFLPTASGQQPGATRSRTTRSRTTRTTPATSYTRAGNRQPPPATPFPFSHVPSEREIDSFVNDMDRTWQTAVASYTHKFQCMQDGVAAAMEAYAQPYQVKFQALTKLARAMQECQPGPQQQTLADNVLSEIVRLDTMLRDKFDEQKRPLERLYSTTQTFEFNELYQQRENDNTTLVALWEQVSQHKSQGASTRTLLDKIEQAITQTMSRPLKVEHKSVDEILSPAIEARETFRSQLDDLEQQARDALKKSEQYNRQHKTKYGLRGLRFKSTRFKGSYSQPQSGQGSSRHERSQRQRTSMPPRASGLFAEGHTSYRSAPRRDRERSPMGFFSRKTSSRTAPETVRATPQTSATRTSTPPRQRRTTTQTPPAGSYTGSARRRQSQANSLPFYRIPSEQEIDRMVSEIERAWQTRLETHKHTFQSMQDDVAAAIEANKALFQANYQKITKLVTTMQQLDPGSMQRAHADNILSEIMQLDIKLHDKFEEQSKPIEILFSETSRFVYRTLYEQREADQKALFDLREKISKYKSQSQTAGIILAKLEDAMIKIMSRPLTGKHKTLTQILRPATEARKTFRSQLDGLEKLANDALKKSKGYNRQYKSKSGYKGSSSGFKGKGKGSSSGFKGSGFKGSSSKGSRAQAQAQAQAQASKVHTSKIPTSSKVQAQNLEAIRKKARKRKPLCQPWHQASPRNNRRGIFSNYLQRLHGEPYESATTNWQKSITQTRKSVINQMRTSRIWVRTTTSWKKTLRLEASVQDKDTHKIRTR